MSKTTLNRRLSKLAEVGRLSVSDMKQIKIPDNNGRDHESTIYNLNVLNQLAMVELDNDAKEKQHDVYY